MPKQVFLAMIYQPSPSPGLPVLPVRSLFDLAPASVPRGGNQEEMDGVWL